MAEIIEGVDSTDLNILFELGRTGSLTVVAQHLNISGPAISQRIKRLEDRLDIALTERAGRNVRLTSAGQILAMHGGKIVSEFEKALQKIDALKNARGGTLRLVGFPSASATIVPDMMRLLRELAPGVTLQYKEAEPPAALDMLKQGHVDCALIFDYQDSVTLPAGATYTPLWKEQLFLVVGEDDPRVSGSDVSSAGVQMDAFSDDHWIAGCEKCRGNLLAAAAEHDFEPNIVQETDNIPAMVAMVAAGSAVALVPGLALAGMRSLPSGAASVPLARARYRSVGIVAMETQHQNPAVRLASELAAKVDPIRWGLEPISGNIR